MGGTFNKITTPVKKITDAATNSVNRVFKVAEKSVSTVADGAKKGVSEISKGLGLTPDIPDMKVNPPAAPAPSPEQSATDVSRPENIGRSKRKGRNGLRIDLNTGGAPSGNGVNIPVG